MYYQNYEDYLRYVLGYPNSYDNYTYENSNYYYDENNRDYNLYEKNIQEEDMYPEIYKKINPIVCNKCDGFNEKVTKEAVENIVDNIYSALVEQDNLENNNRQTRQNNPLLRDLITILVLNRLIRRKENIRPRIPYQRPIYPRPPISR